MGDTADARKKLLLNLISEVKARLDGKVETVNFPIPQFIVVGKQSVGKSRLIEGLAGEPFNFVSGTLGSRRPTVLELRNVPNLSPARWSVFDDRALFRSVWGSCLGGLWSCGWDGLREAPFAS